MKVPIGLELSLSLYLISFLDTRADEVLIHVISI